MFKKLFGHCQPPGFLAGYAPLATHLARRSVRSLKPICLRNLLVDVIYICGEDKYFASRLASLTGWLRVFFPVSNHGSPPLHLSFLSHSFRCRNPVLDAFVHWPTELRSVQIWRCPCLLSHTYVRIHMYTNICLYGTYVHMVHMFV